MAVTPLDSELFKGLFADAPVAACFSDTARIQTLLDVEAALARSEARLGLIPSAAAARIAECASAERVDVARVRAGIERDGFPVIALVAELREAVGAEAAPHVHWGATTQDIMDTALVLQVRCALDRLRAQLDGLVGRLCDLADEHRHTVMAGRTHARQALPITFGLKVAAWIAPLERHRARLADLSPRLLNVQFGGAAGTLAALGDRGIAVMEALAEELRLEPALMPWHAQRDGLADFAGWLSLVSGSLAKMAQDVILLAQSELGEVAESAQFGRGGSSTMPHKSNPVASEVIVACARTNASLLSAMHQALIQEHERATHGLQLEWLTLPQMVVLTSGALKQARVVADHLTIDAGRMADNLERSGGLVLSEAFTYALSQLMPREAAHHHVSEACRTAVSERRPLLEVVRERVRGEIPEGAVDWQTLADPAHYLGEAERLIDRVLAQARAGEDQRSKSGGEGR